MPDAADPSTSPSISAARPLILVTAPAPNTEGVAAASGLMGQLAVTEEGCFAVQPDESQPATPAVFPEGTVPLEDDSGVDVPGFGELHIGDSFVAQGLWTPVDADLKVPVECNRDLMPIIFSIISR